MIKSNGFYFTSSSVPKLIGHDKASDISLAIS